MECKQAFSGKHADLTNKVLKAFFKVYNTLGYGFAAGKFMTTVEKAH